MNNIKHFLTSNFFLCLDGQQSIVVCCHNDTLACSTSMLPDCFKSVWNCECYVPCYTSSCLFTYFGFFGSHYNSSVSSVKYRLQNVKSQYQHVYWKVLTAELLELGAIFSSAEVSGFLQCQLQRYIQI